MYSLKGIVFKGAIEGVPHPIVHEMMKQQFIQTGKADHTVFEGSMDYSAEEGGFDWDHTEQGEDFWLEVIHNVNYAYFFQAKRDGSVSFTPTESIVAGVKPSTYRKPEVIGGSAEIAPVEVASNKKHLIKGDLVYVSDISDEDAIEFKSERIFIKMTEYGYGCTTKRSYEEDSDPKIVDWTYVVSV